MSTGRLQLSWRAVLHPTSSQTCLTPTSSMLGHLGTELASGNSRAALPSANPRAGSAEGPAAGRAQKCGDHGFPTWLGNLESAGKDSAKSVPGTPELPWAAVPAPGTGTAALGNLSGVTFPGFCCFPNCFCVNSFTPQPNTIHIFICQGVSLEKNGSGERLLCKAFRRISFGWGQWEARGMQLCAQAELGLPFSQGV